MEGQISLIGIAARLMNVLVVNPNSGLTSLQQILERARAQPGRMTFASSGSGSSPTAPADPEAPDLPQKTKEAVNADPGFLTIVQATPVQKKPTPLAKTRVPPGAKPPPVPAALTLKAAAANGTPFARQCPKSKKGGGK